MPFQELLYIEKDRKLIILFHASTDGPGSVVQVQLGGRLVRQFPKGWTSRMAPSRGCQLMAAIGQHLL